MLLCFFLGRVIMSELENRTWTVFALVENQITEDSRITPFLAPRCDKLFSTDLNRHCSQSFRLDMSSPSYVLCIIYVEGFFFLFFLDRTSLDNPFGVLRNFLARLCGYCNNPPIASYQRRPVLRLKVQTRSFSFNSFIDFCRNVHNFINMAYIFSYKQTEDFFLMI